MRAKDFVAPFSFLPLVAFRPFFRRRNDGLSVSSSLLLASMSTRTVVPFCARWISASAAPAFMKFQVMILIWPLGEVCRIVCRIRSRIARREDWSPIAVLKVGPSWALYVGFCSALVSAATACGAVGASSTAAAEARTRASARTIVARRARVVWRRSTELLPGVRTPTAARPDA